MTYHARKDDPETSHMAAASVVGTSELQDDILALLHRYGPMTDEQLIARHNAAGMCPRADSRIRTARHELEGRGVEWTGEHGTTDRGGKTRVWQATGPAPSEQPTLEWS